MSSAIEKKLAPALDALQRGDLESAEQLCRELLSLSPEHPVVLHLLGIVCLRRGKTNAALELLRRACELQPGNPDAMVSLGLAVQRAGRNADALGHFRSALAVAPAHLEALHHLAAALNFDGAFAEAYSRAERLLALAPGHVPGITEMGIALQGLGRYDEAERYFRDAAGLEPANPWPHYHLAAALAAQNRFDDAIARLEQALALLPDFAEAWNALGGARQHLGRLEDALLAYRKALDLQPDYAEAELNLATALLYRGDFREGWQHYEARFNTVPPRVVRRNLPSPLATPRTLRDGTLAICAEQGLGDKILHSSILPELVSEGIDFVCEVDERMLAAYARSFPGHRFVPKREPAAQPLLEARAHVHAASLFGMLRERREDFRRQPEKFISSDPLARARFRQRIEAAGAGVAVAISWKSALGGQQRLVQVRKSATLAAFAHVARIPGVRLVDVQYGDTAGEREAFARATGMEILRMDEVDHLNDIDAVLAIIDACDLVLTTSNVTAHFAGALGKPAVLLYLAARPPFYYWIGDGAGRSLWYPSIEILTAPDITQWPDLLERAGRRLQRMDALKRGGA
jgi:Flp pilus assembly protein TadD